MLLPYYSAESNYPLDIPLSCAVDSQGFSEEVYRSGKTQNNWNAK